MMKSIAIVLLMLTLVIGVISYIYSVPLLYIILQMR